MTHPLENPSNLTQEKIWIIPLEFKIKVDDASKYDTEMDGLLKKVLNELRSIVSTFDGNKKQFSCQFLPPIKDVTKFHEVAKSVESAEVIKSNEDGLRKLVAEEIAKLLKPKA
jgi:hypothetical protein